MSFGKDFLAAVRAVDGKSLEQKVITSGAGGRFMAEGSHPEVRVVGVERDRLDENMLTIKYGNDHGGEHNDRLFLVEVDRKTGKNVINWKFTNLLGALIPSVDAYDALLAEIVIGNAGVFDLFIGMRLGIILKRGRGYVIDTVRAPEGEYYQAKDRESGEQLAVNVSIDELKAGLKERGLKPAYMNVNKYTNTHGESNINTFGLSLKALRQPKPATGFPNFKVAGGV